MMCLRKVGMGRLRQRVSAGCLPQKVGMGYRAVVVGCPRQEVMSMGHLQEGAEGLGCQREDVGVTSRDVQALRRLHLWSRGTVAKKGRRGRGTFMRMDTPDGRAQISSYVRVTRRRHLRNAHWWPLGGLEAGEFFR